MSFNDVQISIEKERNYRTIGTAFTSASVIAMSSINTATKPAGYFDTNTKSCAEFHMVTTSSNAVGTISVFGWAGAATYGVYLGDVVLTAQTATMDGVNFISDSQALCINGYQYIGTYLTAYTTGTGNLCALCY